MCKKENVGSIASVERKIDSSIRKALVINQTIGGPFFFSRENKTNKTEQTNTQKQRQCSQLIDQNKKKMNYNQMPNAFLKRYIAFMNLCSLFAFDMSYRLNDLFHTFPEVFPAPRGTLISMLLGLYKLLCSHIEG